MATDAVLTKREQETFDAIKAEGRAGATFPGLVKKLDINSDSTLRPRLKKLSKMGKIRIKRQKEDARKALYFAVKN